MKTLAIAGAAVLATACAGVPSDDYLVQIDARFSDAERADIESALLEWESTTGGRVRFFVDVEAAPAAPDVLPDGGIFVAYYDREHNVCPAGEDLRSHDPESGHRTVGRAYAALGGHVECLDTSTRYFRRLVLHETGHVLGLKHDVPPSVMTPSIGDASANLTQRDVAQWCTVSGRC